MEHERPDRGKAVLPADPPELPATPALDSPMGKPQITLTRNTGRTPGCSSRRVMAFRSNTLALGFPGARGGFVSPPDSGWRPPAPRAHCPGHSPCRHGCPGSPWSWQSVPEGRAGLGVSGAPGPGCWLLGSEGSHLTLAASRGGVPGVYSWPGVSGRVHPAGRPSWDTPCVHLDQGTSRGSPGGLGWAWAPAPLVLAGMQVTLRRAPRRVITRAAMSGHWILEAALAVTQG